MTGTPVLLLASILTAGNAVVYEFTAPWCGYCRQMAPVVRQLEDQGFAVQTVDLDEDPETAIRFKVDRIPCLVVTVDGKETGRLVGLSSLDEAVRLIRGAGIAPQPIRPRQSRGQSPDALASVSPEINAPWRVVNDPAAIDLRRGTAAAPPSPPAAPRTDASPAAMREASVRLRIADPTGNSVGSGTIVDFTNGVALIVTCGHVFRDSQGKGEVLVDVFEPYRIDGLSGRVVDFDLESDVGLVICRSDRPLTAVRVAGPERPVTKDEPVIGIGCNHGEEPTVRQGRILAVNKFLGPPNLQVSGQPVQGRSGGGLFSMESQLIGVCNAADPSDDAGLFAAAANIHALLDRTRLGHVYRQKAGPSMAEVASETSPGTMPRRMPEDGPFRLAGNPAPAATGPSGIRERAVAPNGLDAQEQAFLTEIARTADDAEVICIIRPRSRPDAKSQILVLDSASPAFIQAMSALTSETEKRALTLTEERQHEGRPLKWKSRASPAGSGQREAASNRQ